MMIFLPFIFVLKFQKEVFLQKTGFPETIRVEISGIPL